MVDVEERLRLTKLIAESVRSPELAGTMPTLMIRRERVQGLELAARWDALQEEIREWLSACGERILQDQVTAET
jgi:hypothetical protein